ncbi:MULTISPECIES: alpha/beta hydrolase [unclassified Variovorax]|jgi:pimeloyl-ACP methyl ester carboxylesterase|uniref:alpha/beta fold hydrolase n=1 Tax=unclassified Variovorax TaxID=663243 RepID=UPI000F7E7F49|nr:MULTISPECIES: alpha/beta hydrolase [unclassified Variovorax]RSZ31446.1 alpha/beta hydrolase [Variovorax sp. 553]RSZ31804.1 alpha/beta hydrolase [Variovorax sp. 679]
MTALPEFRSEEARVRYIAAYDAVVRDWPVPFEEIDVETRLGPTHLIASGPPDAPPLLLLGSFAASATVWRVNVEALSQHFRTYAIDVIGQAGKSRAMHPIRNRRDYAPWLGDVLDALAVRRASIVGCSFGAMLALSQASLMPERVDRVVLISPVGAFASQYWKLTYATRIKAPLVKFARRLVRSKKTRSLADMGLKPPADLKWATLMGMTMISFSKVAITRAPAFGGRELRAIRAPALLLIGDAEKLYEPEAMLERAKRRMPGLEGAVVPGADHIAAMSQPGLVNDRIIRFLKKPA